MAPPLGMQAHQNVHTRHSLILAQGAHATAPTNRSTLIRGHHGLNIDSRQLIRLSQRGSHLSGRPFSIQADRNTCCARIEPKVMQHDVEFYFFRKLRLYVWQAHRRASPESAIHDPQAALVHSNSSRNSLAASSTGRKSPSVPLAQSLL